MEMYIKRDNIIEVLAGFDINIEDDTKYRGIRVASGIKWDSIKEVFKFKMGSNEYMICNREFNRVLFHILEILPGIEEFNGLAGDECKKYIQCSI